MTVKALVGNGPLLMRDHGVMATPSTILTEGVRKNYLNECEVTTNQVDTGMVFVEVTRDAVSPSEVFLVPLWVTAPHVVDTSGNGWIIARVNEAVLDAENASADGSSLVSIEKVTSLPSGSYAILATLSSGTITDARTYAEISEYILKNPIFYDEDVAVSDAYSITVNGVTEYKDGQEFWFKANTANTGAATFEVNSLGAKALKIRTDADLTSGDIEEDSMVGARYDAGNDWFQMITPSSLAPTTLTKATKSEAEAGTDNDTYVTPLRVKEAILYNKDWYGDGSDGDVTISSPTTLTRDMFYNNLTVNDTLSTGGFRIYVKGILTGTGVIQNNGGNGGNAVTQTGGVAGAAAPGLTVPPGLVGVVGGAAQNNGVTGAAATKAMGAVGVNGGGTPSCPSPKTGGVGSANSGTRYNQLKTFLQASYLFDMLPTTYTNLGVSASSGSGAGAGGAGTATDFGAGGGSGAPGGVVWI